MQNEIEPVSQRKPVRKSSDVEPMPLRTTERFMSFHVHSMPEIDSPKEIRRSIIMKPFLRYEDRQVDLLLAKLDILAKWQQSANNIFKTKDPLLDLSVQLFAKYELKVAIFYQDKDADKFIIRGIKEIEVLHRALIELDIVLHRFPILFVKSIGLKYLTLCDSMEAKEGGTVPTLNILEGVILMKNHFLDGDTEKLRRHIFKIIYSYMQQKYTMINKDLLRNELPTNEDSKIEFQMFCDIAMHNHSLEMKDEDLAEDVLKLKKKIESIANI